MMVKAEECQIIEIGVGRIVVNMRNLPLFFLKIIV